MENLTLIQSLKQMTISKLKSNIRFYKALSVILLLYIVNAITYICMIKFN
jgi:hypothetical protein